MAINFPNSPVLNDTLTVGSKTFIYDGTKWIVDSFVGYTGSQGATGFTGSAGATGFTGSRGATGFTGSLGFTGSQGTQGAVGFTGSRGATGFTGSQGAQGTQGVIGFTGSRGATGFTGSQGAQGTQGAVGFTGSRGATGFTGSAGPSTTINSANDTTTTTLYPVMVGATGSNQTAKSTTTKLTFNASTGTLSATNFSSLSDATTKRNINTIQDSVTKILLLRGVYYNRIDDEDEKRYTGVIAQEIEKVLPEVVMTNEFGYKTVAYGNIVGLLIEGMKEMHGEIERLKKDSNGV